MQWLDTEERQLERESSHGVEADDMMLGEEFTRALWRRRPEELDPIDLIKTLTITVPTQRHIPKSFQGPFRAIRMDLLSMINTAQQTGGWRTWETQMRAPSAASARTQEQPSRRARNEEAYTLQCFQKFLRGEWPEMLDAEERESRRSLPQMETAAGKSSKIIGALANGNFTKAMAQLTSFGVAPMTDAHFIHGNLSEETQRALMLQTVTPLNKGTKGKPRPLGCAATFRRVACGALVRAEAANLAKVFGPTQYYSTGNKFERFRWFLELICRFEFEFRRREIFFLNDSNFWCVHVNVPWPVSAHAIPFRMLWLP